MALMISLSAAFTYLHQGNLSHCCMTQVQCIRPKVIAHWYCCDKAHADWFGLDKAHADWCCLEKAHADWYCLGSLSTSHLGQ